MRWHRYIVITAGIKRIKHGTESNSSLARRTLVLIGRRCVCYSAGPIFYISWQYILSNRIYYFIVGRSRACTILAPGGGGGDPGRWAVLIFVACTTPTIK